MMRLQGSISTAIAATAVAVLAFCGIASGAQAAFSAADVYRNASPSVVVIFGFDSAKNGASGTGSLVTSDGMVLTNNHVVTNAKTGKPYSSIRVFFKPARITGDVAVDLRESYPIRVVARDAELDLALIQVQGAPRGVPVLPLGDSERVDIGSSVAAIGHPGGGGLWTLTTGTVSSRRKDGKRDIFQTDAAINPGNSGGPLLDGNGHLIGVNTFVRRVNAQGLPLEGLNYSLRSSLVRQWLGQQGVGVSFAQAVQQPGAPAPPPITRPAPPQIVEPDPEPEPPQARPEPQASTPSPSPSPGSSPAPSPSPSHSPPTPDEPRAFKGPNGEEMYGIPQRDFSLMGAAGEVYQQAFENANKAFDSLDSEFD